MNLSLNIKFFFFFNDPAPTEIYTLSLHDALPISFPAGVPAFVDFPAKLLRRIPHGEPATHVEDCDGTRLADGDRRRVLPSATGPDPAVLVDLAGPAQGEGLRRNIFGDSRARGDNRVPADSYRRYQHGAASDEATVFDHGGILLLPVVVTGDGPCANIHVRPERSVTEVSQVRSLRPAADV